MKKYKKKLRGKQLKKVRPKLRHREMVTLITGRVPKERKRKIQTTKFPIEKKGYSRWKIGV